MIRKDKVLTYLLLAVIVAFQIVPASAFQIGNAQVWGHRYRANSYWGSDIYQNTPNPSISAPNWTGGPNGLTTLNTGLYIESGPTKACDVDCGLHPYGSWGGTSDRDEFVDTTVWLGGGLTYHYKTNYIGNNQWQSVFCSGSGCRGMITGNVGTFALPFVASGGESSGVRWGSITTSHAAYKPYSTTTWYSWCYTDTQNNVGGTISACNTSNFSWTSSY